MPIQQNGSYLKALSTRRSRTIEDTPSEIPMDVISSAENLAIYRLGRPQDLSVSLQLVRLRVYTLVRLGLSYDDALYISNDMTFKEECFFLKTTDRDYIARLRVLVSEIHELEAFKKVSFVLKVQLALRSMDAWCKDRQSGFNPYEGSVIADLPKYVSPGSCSHFQLLLDITKRGNLHLGWNALSRPSFKSDWLL